MANGVLCSAWIIDTNIQMFRDTLAYNLCFSTTQQSLGQVNRVS